MRFELFLEMFAPAIGQSRVSRGAQQPITIFRAASVEFNHVGDGDVVLVTVNAFDHIAGADFALFDNGQVKARAAAVEKAFDHVVAVEFRGELEAWHSRLRDHQGTCADAETVPDIDLGLRYTFGRQILTEHSPGQVKAGKFTAPEVIMSRRVCVDGFIGAAVDLQIGLTITVEVKFPHGDSSRDALFENSRRDDAVLPENFPWKTDVD